MKAKQTRVPLPLMDTLGVKNCPGAVQLTDLPETGHLPARTSLVMNRFLFTMVETDITKGEAEAMVNALCEHFNIEVVPL